VNSSVTERADSAALGVAFGPPWSTGVPGLRMTSAESVSTFKGRAGARRRCEAGQETCGRLDRPAFDQVQIIVSGRARQPARHKPHRAQHPYALADHVEHPLSVSLREGAVFGQIDHWLALEFVPRRIAETIHDLAAALDHATTAAWTMVAMPNDSSPSATANSPSTEKPIRRTDPDQRVCALNLAGGRHPGQSL
jgi:hypothetical protein